MSFSTEMILIPKDRIDEAMTQYLGDKFKTAYVCPINAQVSALYFDVMMLTFNIDDFTAEFSKQFQCDAILFFNAEDFGWSADHYKNGICESAIRVDYEAEDSGGLVLKNPKGFEAFIEAEEPWAELMEILERLQHDWLMDSVMECVTSFTAALDSEWLDLHNYRSLELSSKKKLREMGVTEINPIKKVNPFSVVKKVFKKELAPYGFYITNDSYGGWIYIVRQINGYKYGLVVSIDKWYGLNEYNIIAYMQDSNKRGYAVEPGADWPKYVLVKSEEEMADYVRRHMRLFLEKGLPWLESLVQLDFDHKKIFNEVVDRFMEVRGCMRALRNLDTLSGGSVEYSHDNDRIKIEFPDIYST